PDRRILLILDESGVVEGADEPALAAEQLEEAFIVDVEAEGARRGVEICAVDEKSNPLLRVEKHRNHSKNDCTTEISSGPRPPVGGNARLPPAHRIVEVSFRLTAPAGQGGRRRSGLAGEAEMKEERRTRR